MTEPGTCPVSTYGGVPVRNVWHMLLYAWKRVHEVERWRGEAESARTLDALLAAVLARLLEQRMRIGLGRDYVGVERVLRGVRGRIDMARSIRERRFERGEAACRFTSFEADAPRNQIVRSVLARLVQVGDFGADDAGRALRRRLQRLTRDLHEVSIIEVDAALIRRQELGRNDADYRLMLAVCTLIVEGVLPSQRAGLRTVPRWDHDQAALRRLYEEFVPAFYRHHLSDWRVATQPQWSWPAKGRFLPRMVPDVVLDHHAGSRRIVLDTKFTPHALRAGRFDVQKLDTGHLYQLYAYLRTQEERSPRDRAAAGVLLYPSIGTTLREQHELQGHLVLVATVDLAANWASIESELWEVMHIAAGGSVAPDRAWSTVNGESRERVPDQTSHLGNDCLV